MSYSPKNPNGQATMANSEPVVLASDQSTVPVSAASLPLPAGASTSANQTTIIGHLDGVEGLLTTIDADTGNISTKIDTIAGAVSGTEMQVDVLTMPSVTVTATNLDIRDLVFASDKVDVSGSSSVGVTGTFWQATQPISIAQDVMLGTDFSDVLGTTSLILATQADDIVNTVDGLQTSSFGYMFDGSTWDRVRGTSADGLLVNLGANNDVTASQTGTWTVQPGNTQNTTEWLVIDKATTTGGLSKAHLVSAATTNATNVKASAGQVYAITAFNLNASARYLKFHNTAGTPTAGTGVTDTYLIPGNTAGAGLVINIDKGIAFSTGIAFTLVTGIADANNTAVAADEIVINVYYK